MALTLKDLADLSTTMLATGVGFIVYKKLGLFYRFLLLQAFIYLVTDLIALNLNPNAWIYNLLILVETILLFSAAQAYFRSAKSKQVLLILTGVFSIIFFTDIFYFSDIKHFASHAAIAEGFLVSGVYLAILYFHFSKKADSSVNSGVALACIGIILYFACYIPYLSLMLYFQGKDAAMNKNIFQSIIIPLQLARYFFLAVSLYLAGRNSSVTSSNSAQHDR